MIGRRLVPFFQDKFLPRSPLCLHYALVLSQKLLLPNAINVVAVFPVPCFKLRANLIAAPTYCGMLLYSDLAIFLFLELPAELKKKYLNKCYSS